MTREIRRVLVVAVVVALLLGGLRLLLTPDHTRRNLEYFPDMATSPALESQSVSAFLPGGLGQQLLVPGVVVRGAERFPYDASEEAAVRAGLELRNPLDAADDAHRSRGAEVYRVHCSHCHDPAGDGRGGAVLRGMLPPPSFKAANAVQMPDGRLYHVLTRGQGNMPSFRAQLEPDERWSVILHLRTLQAGGAK